MGRRRARELAFRTLFQSERGGQPLLEVWRSVRQELAEEPEEDPAEAAYGEPLTPATLAFAEGLLKSYDADRERLDAELAESITGWTFTQMSQTDLNVLRLAVTEMRYGDDAPEVAIEMAVRLAKKFGGDESGRFVNGVLAKVLRRLNDAAQDEARPAADAQAEGEAPDPDPDKAADGP
ncbi:MAG: transcription antitermination factor NusB [Deinococcales bacterium]|nr:transcription antitermination factor NusB [Deinococcales bacterium]